MKIKTPPEGAAYRLGKVVHASYKCKSAATTIASCVGAVPKASAIDTSTPRSHASMATAIDANGTDDERDDAPDGHELKLLQRVRPVSRSSAKGPSLVDGSV